MRISLAQFIENNMGQLLNDWEEAALAIAPEMKGKDSLALRNHAREMLKFIVQDLGTARGKGGLPASCAGEEHSAQRHQQGMSLLQTVQELGALRARVVRGWSDKHRKLTRKDIDELVRFNDAIDRFIGISITNFSALKDQRTRLIDAMLDVSPDPVAIFEPDGKFMFLNKAMADMANAPNRDAIGKTPYELNLDEAAKLQEAISAAVTTGQAQRRDHIHHLPSGRELYFDCQFVPVLNDRNEIEAIVKTSRNITERKKNEYQVWKSANFDVLTGIPNRRLFVDRLEQTMLEAKRKDNAFAVLFIDLDHFKQANDQLGHEAGDRLLVQVAKRMSTQVRAMDTVARLGGDEFTLILKETDRGGATEVARALLASLEEAFEVDTQRVNISGSIGLTVFPDDGQAVDQLMHNADQAMYTAKSQGGRQVQVYESWMAQSESEHMRLSRELKRALGANQLEVYYQPIIDIHTGAISGTEALLRWNHPDLGLLTPGTFLSATQQSDMADSIAAYVLEQAVHCQFRWRNLNDKPLPVNINESPISFFNRGVVDQWQARMAKIGLDESWITMELTPASLNNLRASGFNPAKKLGLPDSTVKLAIDGFGIEPSSLCALQEFRMDSIKIDRELIKDAGRNGDTDRMLEGIIAMAHAINVQVVGVGVEKYEQLRVLSRAGCDYAQGFLFSRPLPLDDFETFLVAQHRRGWSS